MAKDVYYIGYYHGKNCKHRKCADINIASSMKMDFIIHCLKRLNYNVHLVSITISNKPGIYRTEYVKVDDKEDHYYLGYFGIKIGGRVRGAGRIAILSLLHFARKHFNRNSIVINYHSLDYGTLFLKLKSKLNFMWYPQIEEIYCLSRKDYQNPQLLQKEAAMFKGADGYLFVNDLLASKYADGKPYAVSYGNYKIFLEKPAYQGNEIGIVYTGVINEDRGAFRILDVMEQLPEQYKLHILGFGNEENLRRFHEKLTALNARSKRPRIYYYGTKTGSEYTDFLGKYQIGVSLMNTEDEIAQNAFPSKILAYMGHSLFVLSSNSECVVKSRVAKELYFCENTVESIADAIMKIPVHEKNTSADCLKKMETDFLQDLKQVLEGEVGDEDFGDRR